MAQIRIKGDWDLDMVGELSHAYVQVYAASCFLLLPSLEGVASFSDDRETGRYSYPWRGGYSAVNFFRSIYAALPKRYHPVVLEMSYASPGFIELLGYSAAITLLVRTLTANAARILSVYKEVQEEIRKRQLNKLEVRERKAQVQFVESAYARLAEAMDIPPSATEKLHASTGRDVWARLKILLALARRIDNLAAFLNSGKAELNEGEPVERAMLNVSSEDKLRKIRTTLEQETRLSPAADDDSK